MTFGQTLQITHREEDGDAGVDTLITSKRTYKHLLLRFYRLERETTSEVSQDRYPT